MAIKLTKKQREDITSNLAEGFHTAFRKASGHPDAHKIWALIRNLPSDEWGSIIQFVVDGTFPKKNAPDPTNTPFNAGDIEMLAVALKHFVTHPPEKVSPVQFAIAQLLLERLVRALTWGDVMEQLRS
jgi:hypothetical protein